MSLVSDVLFDFTEKRVCELSGMRSRAT